uniref:(northern house mosquito) hypothetical protein n=1 Tax=Culex pipiens TaxID=7175 RepID=A0A8D8KPX6_CULPI
MQEWQDFHRCGPNGNFIGQWIKRDSTGWWTKTDRNSTERRTKTTALPPRRWSKRNLVQGGQVYGITNPSPSPEEILNRKLTTGTRRPTLSVSRTGGPLACGVLHTACADALHRAKSLVTLVASNKHDDR